jgi:quercetin dioxygenase-like cupin family protein
MKLDGSWESPVPGIRRRLKSLGSSLMSMEVEFEAGAVGAMHHHIHEQQTLCVSGYFRFNIGGEEHLLRAGEMVNIKSNLPHEAVALESGVLLDTFTPVREDLLERESLS